MIEETTELPADAVRRQAQESDQGSTPAATATKDDQQKEQLKRLERENARLKQLVGELVLEKAMRDDKKPDRD